MKKLRCMLALFVMCIASPFGMANPANMAGDTYLFSNYLDLSTPGALEATMTFTDEFMLRAGPGELDTSLKGVEYDVSFNIEGLLLLINQDAPGPFPPDYFSIDYDPDGLPLSFTFAAQGLWSLDVDLVLNTAALSSPAALFDDVLVVPELIIDGFPSPVERIPAVDPTVSAMQQIILAYYSAVAVEESPSKLRTANHIRTIDSIVADLMDVRTELVQSLAEQGAAAP